MNGTSMATSYRRKRLIACLALIGLSNPVSAYDAKGLFMMGGGVGGVICPAYLDYRNDYHAGPANQSTSWSKMARFTMFIEGYRTAYNELQPGVADIFGGLEDDQLLTWTENWCRSNPLDKFSSAVIALARHQHEQRVMP